MVMKNHESSSGLAAVLLAGASAPGSTAAAAAAAAVNKRGSSTDVREIMLDVAIAIATFVVLQLLGIPFWLRLLANGPAGPRPAKSEVRESHLNVTTTGIPNHGIQYRSPHACLCCSCRTGVAFR